MSDTPTNQPPTRRIFLTSAAACTAAAFLYLRLPHAASAASAPEPLPATVTIVQFGPDGKPTGKATLPRVTHPDSEWRQQLSPMSFEVTRHEATERPYTGDTWNLHEKGLYRCVCCQTALFHSDTKFESGTGWPSFYQPIAKENVLERTDSTLGMTRTAVSCRLCDAHLGHVFDDGPQPTGLRYCMNSAAMKFNKLV